MGSFLGGIVGGIIAKVIGWLALIGIGKKEQAAADTSATLAIVEKERDALVAAGSAEEAAKRHDF